MEVLTAKQRNATVRQRDVKFMVCSRMQLTQKGWSKRYSVGHRAKDGLD